jgi:hypothetical protein
MKRWLTLTAVLLATLGLTGSSKAGPGGCTNEGSLFPFAFETITVSTTALGFTAATLEPAGARPADLAVVTVESNAVRYRADGLNPTATVGHVAAADASLSVCGTHAIRRIRFIRKDAADSTLSVSYYRGGDQ